MRIDAIDIHDPLSRPPATGDALRGRQREFADALGRAAAHEDPDEKTPEQTAREAAQGLVAAAFIRPLLSRIREQPMAAPPFAPTQGEKQFRSLADAQLADKIVQASNLPIVERLTQDLLQRARAVGQLGVPGAIEVDR